MPPRQPWIHRSDAGIVALAQGFGSQVGYYLEPLESMWQFACPIAAADLSLVGQLAELVRRESSQWNLLILAGLKQDGRLFRELVRQLSPHFRVGLINETFRHVADLTGSVDAILSRRSRNFRRNLLRAQRAAQQRGLRFAYLSVFADAAATDAVYARIQAVEAKSWKGLRDCGIKSGAMHRFYKLMLRRLGPAGHLRVLFAVHEGRDVGYVFGGVLGQTYRGLQIAYDNTCRDWSLGHLCQLEQMGRLVDEGVTTYDLGSAMGYKARWADREHCTVALAALR